MPYITICWESAGHPDQDESLSDEIADFATLLLKGYDPLISGALNAME